MNRSRISSSVVALLLSAAALASAQTPNLLGPPFIEAMTWTEIRAAIDGGKKVVIIPTGGVEQNGPHMVLGKHNYIVTFTAGVLAERMGNALVAPTVKWVPEGNPNSPRFPDKPGVISNPSPAFESLLDAAARSLKAHGFTDIILIGDSGGNQGGLTATANKLNEEWKGTDTKVYAITAYYAKSRTDIRAWLLKEFGYDGATVGSHAGITDTSQLMYIRAEGIRTGKILPGGGSPNSGVSGDPTKATVEIGKKVTEFKVNAALEQYKELKGAKTP